MQEIYCGTPGSEKVGRPTKNDAILTPVNEGRKGKKIIECSKKVFSGLRSF